jgi:hypothetical protein
MKSLSEMSVIRKGCYALFLAVAAGSACGRIVGVERVYEPRLTWPAERPLPLPTHGANDRSRWDTVRALVESGTYVIGHWEARPPVPRAVSLLAAGDGLQAALLAAAGLPRDSGLVTQEGWQTIDKVLNPTTGDFYSSKPPLLATLVAGLYWLLYHLCGWSFAGTPLHPEGQAFEIVRTILLLVNGLPFVLYLGVLARLVERYGQTDWGRCYVLAAACFATLVTPFLTTLNNHTVATFCVLFALAAALPLLEQGVAAPAAGRFLGAGFAIALASCFELPAASLAVALFLLLWRRAPRLTLTRFVPAALIPLAAFFLTNYLALGQWRPAYSELHTPWYQYEGSYWSNPTQKTIDFARNYESRALYAFHLLLGHHGWFSLTPIWFLSLAGMYWGWRQRRQSGCWPALCSPLTLLISGLVLGFYLAIDSRNYGGWTSGLRWWMWLTPLWLLCLLPAADRLAGCRWGRGLAYVFLALSTLSASFPAWNPWRHPWLYRLLDWQGLIPY